MMLPFLFFDLIGLFCSSAPAAVLYSFGRHKRSALKTEFILGLKRFSKHDRTRVNGVSKSFVALILFLVLSLEKETAQKIN